MVSPSTGFSSTFISSASFSDFAVICTGITLICIDPFYDKINEAVSRRLLFCRLEGESFAAMQCQQTVHHSSEMNDC